MYAPVYDFIAHCVPRLAAESAITLTGFNIYVTVLEKRDHLATEIIFGLCILSERGHCWLEYGH